MPTTNSGLAGAAAALAALAVIYGTAWYDGIRERVFDTLTRIATAIPESAQPLVIDIDRDTLQARSGQQLHRADLARIIALVAREQPSVIALDVLVEGEDASSASYHARSLAGLLNDPAMRRLADSLPDDTETLAAAARGTRLVLGLALTPEAGERATATTPVLVRGRLDASRWWTSPGLAGPVEKLSGAARGLGILALPGDPDATVRRVPLLAIAAGRAVPGLALEALRVETDAATYIVSGPDSTVGVGGKRIVMADDGTLRLVESVGGAWQRRTLSAATLEAELESRSLKGVPVVIGSSAPELGGLRTATGGQLVPSVQLHADALAQIRASVFPIRSGLLATLEALSLAALATVAIALGALMSPMIGAAMTGLMSLAWLGGAFAVYAASHALVDPLAGPIALVAGFTVSAITMAAATRRRAQSLQRRFEQHLAPAVVKRIIENPGDLKLTGERREVTSLFTDLEGFTAMTERADPEALVAILDRYFENVSAIVFSHGGMVDKFVGDAVHALFNAPLDMPDHARAAVECAREIDAFSQKFRDEPQPRAIGIGRTRIGIETGFAIVGDVGGGGKLDYTAHGTAINTAARLEAANKELGSTICIGPGAAAKLDPALLRPLAVIPLRGRSEPQMTYSVWPDAYEDADRQAYAAAFHALEHDAAAAARILADLAARFPGDAVLSRLVDRASKQPVAADASPPT